MPRGAKRSPRRSRALVGQLTRLTERARRAVEADTITLREGDRLMRDISTGLDIVPQGRGCTRDRRSGRRAPDAPGAGRAPGARASRNGRLAPLRERPAPGTAHRHGRSDRRVAQVRSGDGQGSSDLAATARALRELHAKWHEVAEAPRHSAQRLWDRFRTATDFIRSRCESYFAQLRTERDANLQQKTAHRGGSRRRSRRRATGARRPPASRSCRRLWQQAGPVPRDAQRDLGQRFRTACNTFFARRREDLDEPEEGLDRQHGQEGSARANAPKAGRIDRLGCRVERDEAAAVRVEEHRAGAPEQVGGHLGPLPRRRRSSSSSGTTTATRSRWPANWPSARRSSSNSNGWARPRSRPGRSGRAQCRPCAPRGTAACRFPAPR